MLQLCKPSKENKKQVTVVTRARRLRRRLPLRQTVAIAGGYWHAARRYPVRPPADRIAELPQCVHDDVEYLPWNGVGIAAGVRSAALSRRRVCGREKQDENEKVVLTESWPGSSLNWLGACRC
jgi:hypothetical protein